MTIQDITKKFKSTIDQFDLELLIAHSLKKTREFVLMYPEFALTAKQESEIIKLLKRRVHDEPVAYITGHKEFYGLDFKVNKHTLIPRPETEELVEQVLQDTRYKIRDIKNTLVVDVGTGSGCIIVSIAKELTSYQLPVTSYEFIAIDISKDALKIAKKNAERHGLNKKIKFLHGSLLEPIAHSLKTDKLIILANLPYLSREIFESAPPDVKNFEPKSALYSPDNGLGHYETLFKQVKQLIVTSYQLPVTILIEFSPEQKKDLQKLIKNSFQKSKTSFQKDLAGKWRTAKISLT